MRDHMSLSEALQVLGLASGATPAEVKEAYRDSVKVWHPDRFAGDPRLRTKAENQLKQVNAAYDYLKFYGTVVRDQEPAGVDKQPERKPESRSYTPKPGESPEGQSHRQQQGHGFARRVVGAARRSPIWAGLTLFVVLVLGFVYMSQSRRVAIVPASPQPRSAQQSEISTIPPPPPINGQIEMRRSIFSQSMDRGLTKEQALQRVRVFNLTVRSGIPSDLAMALVLSACQVPMFDPSGAVRLIPADKQDKAAQAGGVRAFRMRDSKGVLRWVPYDKVEDSRRAGATMILDETVSHCLSEQLPQLR